MYTVFILRRLIFLDCPKAKRFLTLAAKKKGKNVSHLAYVSFRVFFVVVRWRRGRSLGTANLSTEQHRSGPRCACGGPGWVSSSMATSWRTTPSGASRGLGGADAGSA